MVGSWGGGSVEDFGGRKIVLAELSAPGEILVLLHSNYPEPLTSHQIVASVDRKAPKTVTNAIRSLWRRKLVEGDSRTGYKLTRLGCQEAAKVIAQSVAS